jgi:hypothetical protein
MDHELLTERETALFLRCSQAKLTADRRKQCGPPFTRVGKLIRYNRVELLTWLARRTVGRTEITVADQAAEVGA